VRDCHHGSLARSCLTCEQEREIAELRARVGELERGIRRAMRLLPNGDGPMVLSGDAADILGALLPAPSPEPSGIAGQVESFEVYAQEHPTPSPGEVERAAGELAEFGWLMICNAGGGDWTRESKDWQEAAARYRTQYHAYLARSAKSAAAGKGE